MYFNDLNKNFIFSKTDGIFEINVNIDSKITKDDLIGTIHFPDKTKKRAKENNFKAFRCRNWYNK